MIELLGKLYLPLGPPLEGEVFISLLGEGLREGLYNFLLQHDLPHSHRSTAWIDEMNEIQAVARQGA